MKFSLVDVVFSIIILILFVGISSGIYMTSTASGKVDYCYVYESPVGAFPLYTLVGHRSWRQDRNIVSAMSYQEIVDRSNAIKCPFGVGR